MLRIRAFSVAILLVSAAANLHAGVMAAATFTDTEPSPGTFEYDLTLNNVGTTTIGTFWFSWIPGFGFMNATPTNIVAPTGWTDTVTNSGESIRWVTTTALLNPGDSLSGFIFDSTMTPDQMLGPSVHSPFDPVSTFFVYIAAPLGDPGFQGTATESTPEPSSLLLLLAGAGILAYRKRRGA